MGRSHLSCSEALEMQQLLVSFLLPTGRAWRAGATAGDAFKVIELYRKIMGCEIKYWVIDEKHTFIEM